MKKEMKLKGHIIDSLTLSKLLDEICNHEILCYAIEIKVGRRREDVSEAIFAIEAETPEEMELAVKIAKKHGAMEF